MTGITEEQAVLYLTIGFMVIVGIWLIALTYLVLKRTKSAEKKEEEEEEEKEPEAEEEEEEKIEPKKAKEDV